MEMARCFVQQLEDTAREFHGFSGNVAAVFVPARKAEKGRDSMSMYKEVSTNLNFVEREKETEKFWEEHHVFEESVEERKDDPSYTFYDGPPTANGKPHIGHLETRAFKDLFPRYQTMKGKMVPRKAGWDTHGLPVELEVEKLLKINGKEQIEE